MATYQMGSRGSGVKELQSLLNGAGYNLDVDGIFGNHTQSAVRDYQQKSGMAVNGVASDDMLSALRSRSTLSTLEQYKNSAPYQLMGLDALENQLKQYDKSEEELLSQARAQYEPTYQAQLLSLNQQEEEKKLGYQNQLKAQEAEYDRQARQTQAQYDQSAVDLYNQLNRRGLGRSSLVSTQGAYLENQRAQALGDIARERGDAADAINAQIALAARQAADSRAALADSYAQQVEQRAYQLGEENRSAYNDLLLKLASLQMQGYQAYLDSLGEGGVSYSSGSSSSRSSSSSASRKSSKKASVSGSSLSSAGSASSAQQSVLGSLKDKLAALQKARNEKQSTAKKGASGSGARVNMAR